MSDCEQRSWQLSLSALGEEYDLDTHSFHWSGAVHQRVRVLVLPVLLVLAIVLVLFLADSNS